VFYFSGDRLPIYFNSIIEEGKLQCFGVAKCTTSPKWLPISINRFLGSGKEIRLLDIPSILSKVNGILEDVL